jgi:hypothetical protein
MTIEGGGRALTGQGEQAPQVSLSRRVARSRPAHGLERGVIHGVERDDEAREAGVQQARGERGVEERGIDRQLGRQATTCGRGHETIDFRVHQRFAQQVELEGPVRYLVW